MAQEKNMPNGEGEMTFWEHLAAFRALLVRTALVLLVIAIVAFVFKDFIYNNILLAPRNRDFITNRLFCHLGYCINEHTFKIINIDLSGQFTSSIMISSIAGLVVGFPYLVFELWLFIKPALYEHEQKGIKGFVFFTSVLFFVGVGFGYFIIVPLIVEFFSTYLLSEQIENTIQLSSFLSNILMTCLASGIVFELPVLIYFLTKVGILTPSFLRKYRRYAIVLIFFIGAVITPPDVMSQLIVSIPLWMLYEASILISVRVYKKRMKIAG